MCYNYPWIYCAGFWIAGGQRSLFVLRKMLSSFTHPLFHSKPAWYFSSAERARMPEYKQHLSSIYFNCIYKKKIHYWMNCTFKSHLFKLYTKQLWHFGTCDQAKSTWNVKLPEAAFCSQIALAILQRIVLNNLTVILEKNNLAARSIWNEHRYRHL